jgi:hypothetical protein
MPLPKPEANENQQDFISRCMANDVMNSEFPEQDQRAGVCYSQWREEHKLEEECIPTKSKWSINPNDDITPQSIVEKGK